MQGGIRTINSLKKWFYTVNKPFFTLSYQGQANQVILRNTAVEDMAEAWEMLEVQVMAQAEYGRATMHLIVYSKDKANNPDARTNIDMLPTTQNGMAGIGSLPMGYMDEGKVAGLIAAEREKWDMEKRLEDLEAQIQNPGDWVEKLLAGIERIGATSVGQMLAAKYLGAQMPLSNTATIAGTPAPEDTDDTFDDDISHTAAILGVDDTTLARKLRQMVQNNPELARNLLQS